MTIIFDGACIDLDRTLVAADGTRWLWDCDITDSGQPMMARVDQPGQPGETLPLDYLARWHGALVPAPQPTTAALYRLALRAA